MIARDRTKNLLFIGTNDTKLLHRSFLLVFYKPIPLSGLWTISLFLHFWGGLHFRPFKREKAILFPQS